VTVELREDSQYVCSLDDMWFHFCQWQLIFLFSKKFPASFSMGIWDSFLGRKANSARSSPTPLSIAEEKNEWSYTSLPRILIHGI
jgi:hypothetical protein